MLGLTLGWLSVVIATPNVLRLVRWDDLTHGFFSSGRYLMTARQRWSMCCFPRYSLATLSSSKFGGIRNFRLHREHPARVWDFLAALQGNETNFIWHGKRVSHDSSLYRGGAHCAANSGRQPLRKANFICTGEVDAEKGRTLASPAGKRI